MYNFLTMKMILKTIKIG